MAPSGATFPLPGGQLSLSLLKFSYVTTPRMYDKLLWTHVVRNRNLLAVFDDGAFVDSQGSVVHKRALKILQDGQCIVSQRGHPGQPQQWPEARPGDRANTKNGRMRSLWRT